MADVLLKRKIFHMKLETHREKAMCDRGRDWSNATAYQRMPVMESHPHKL
jgi:hypothetical protein